MSSQEKKAGVAKDVGKVGGGLLGAAIGAAAAGAIAGSVIPGLGTAAGAAIGFGGGLLGGVIGSGIGEDVGGGVGALAFGPPSDQAPSADRPEGEREPQGDSLASHGGRRLPRAPKGEGPIVVHNHNDAPVAEIHIHSDGTDKEKEELGRYIIRLIEERQDDLRLGALVDAY